MPALNPPNTPLVDERANIRPEWYRYFVQAKAQTDGFATATVLTVTDSTQAFPAARILSVVPGELTATDGVSSFTLGLANSGIVAGAYGSAAETLAITVDAKGRLTGVAEYQLVSDNVTEGGTNLYFTQARARQAISGGTGINYNNTTGVVELTVPVVVALGGTGATTPANARINLGLVIGADVQAHSSTLDALASYNANGLLVQTATGTFAGRSVTGTANEISVSNGDGVAGNPTISLPSVITLGAKALTGGSFSDMTLTGLSVYADNTAATAGGLAVGKMYRTATGQLMVRF